MMTIIKEIISKLKLKEFVAIVFISTILLLFLTDDFLTRLGIINIRNQYKSYLSIIFVVCMSYYILLFINFVKNKIYIRLYGASKKAITYLKKWISHEEIEFLINTFYDIKVNQFKSTGMAEFSDGRKAGLEHSNIIYRASSISAYGTEFSYNIQPVILKYLNNNIKKGKITITKDTYKWIN